MRASGSIITACLSYLWGIETVQGFFGEASAANVFIVPMRNWNIISYALCGSEIEFLSYLWGIETCQHARFRIDNNCFYRTYEELKH